MTYDIAAPVTTEEYHTISAALVTLEIYWKQLRKHPQDHEHEVRLIEGLAQLELLRDKVDYILHRDKENSA